MDNTDKVVLPMDTIVHNDEPARRGRVFREGVPGV